ncbi:hypothetical protein [Enterocloster sp.]|uniref:hypothetical protein n=1 Tax=Enterocloster sp. TaxID=2719315 RepID=UPI00174A5BC1
MTKEEMIQQAVVIRQNNRFGLVTPSFTVLPPIGQLAGKGPWSFTANSFPPIFREYQTLLSISKARRTLIHENH